MRLEPEEQRNFTRYIHSVTAIALDDSKSYLIENRLADLVRELGCRSYGELLSRAQADAAGLIRRRIIDAITTGETLFFRDNGPFDLLRYKLLPEIADRAVRGGRRSIRIWSAACSTGQELYSIAIIIKEVLGDPDRYGVRLVGTDISDQSVARASRGIYNQIEIGRGLSDAVRDRYFRPVAGGWQIRDEIRAMASFRTLNLMNDFSSLGRFDIVFCRNVAIYFNDRDRVSLFNRIGQSLEREGCLIIGAMESLVAVCQQFESRRHLRSVYYTLKGNGK